ncbi:hypothetical protein MTR_6g080320 [Medicago truncatula]|uniref:Uncharacterized protein n=1 Tax=Medicago truncatula TaxID=3880 RepID=A0A072UBX7_MEDTR|nr:hypothetical protein MTR_6g080320 [Medicago truncatula]
MDVAMLIELLSYGSLNSTHLVLCVLLVDRTLLNIEQILPEKDVFLSVLGLTND